MKEGKVATKNRFVEAMKLTVEEEEEGVTRGVVEVWEVEGQVVVEEADLVKVHPMSLQREMESLSGESSTMV